MFIIYHLVMRVVVQIFLLFIVIIDEIIFNKYNNVDLESSVFIAGQPRSGTTFLHRTLAESNQLYAVKHIEWRYPYITLWYIFDFLGIRNLIEKIPYWPSNNVGHLLQRMHKHNLGDYEEHGIFLEERVFHHHFLTRRMPFVDIFSDVSIYNSNEVAKLDLAARSIARVAKKVQFFRAKGKTWITKENECALVYLSLCNHVKDPKFIFILRESKHFLPSYIDLLLYSTLAKTGINLTSNGKWLAQNLEFRKSECKNMIDLYEYATNNHETRAVMFEEFSESPSQCSEELLKSVGIYPDSDHAQHLATISSQQLHRDKGYITNSISQAQGFDFFDEFIRTVRVAENRARRWRRERHN